jgi:hypothetical protein
MGVGVSALTIDVDASLGASRVWSEWGDSVGRGRAGVADDVDSLVLPDAWSTTALAAAAEHLWTASALLRLVVERVVLADADAGGGVVRFDRAAVDALIAVAERQVAALDSRCAARSVPGGDLDQTYCSEIRSPYDVRAVSDLDRGRQLVARALHDTATGYRIGPDEFEIVEFADGRYLVVLPGVTDLSHPDIGLNDTNRTVRDLDQFALLSSRSSDVDDNRYAEMVWAALRRRGVAAGSELVIVGHSFGADTALDLTGDPSFNGAGGYRVTHVVAAGYFSAPQLSTVPGSTSVLVLENHRDAAVIAEGVGQAGIDDLAHTALDVFAAGWDAGWELAHGDTSGARDRVSAAATDLVTLEPGVRRVADRQVVAVFQGGSDGAGHHPSNYVDYVSSTDDVAVTDFLRSIGSPGGVGTAYAIDVSVR